MALGGAIFWEMMAAISAAAMRIADEIVVASLDLGPI
jgi:hypothetical protein